MTAIPDAAPEHVNRQGEALVVLGGILLILISIIVFTPKAPEEKQVIASFHSQQKTFERLRDMFVADKQLLRVEPSDLQTTTAHGVGPVIDEGNISRDRYEEYLALMTQIGAFRAFRAAYDQPPGICIAVWGSKVVDDSREVQICWAERSTPSQLAGLEGFYNAQRLRYRHIEANWYVWRSS